MEQDDFMTP